MAEHDDAAGVLTRLWELIDAQQWDQLAELLDPDVVVRYVHTGEVLDGPSYLRLNRDYPGRWHASITDLLGVGQRAATITYVSDGPEAYWAASFATTSAGLITELVEVWTEAGQDPPDFRPAQQPAG